MSRPEGKRPAGKGLAVAALVLGIVGVVLGFIPYLSLLSLPLGIAGLVLAVIALRRRSSNGMATAGMVLSILAIGIFFIALSVLGSVVKESSNTGGSQGGGGPVMESADQAAHESVEITKCSVNVLNFPEVRGTVRNTGEDKATVRVAFDITDSKGARIDAAVGFVEDLEPGQIGHFTATALADVGDEKNIECSLADVEIN